MADFTDTEGEFLSVAEAVSFATNRGGNLGDPINIHEAWSLQYRAGASVGETIKLHETLTRQAHFTTVFNELLRISPSVAFKLSLALADTMTLDEAMTTALAVIIAERLKLKDSLTAGQRANLALTETLLMHSALQVFLGGTLSDVLNLSETTVPMWRWVRSLSDTVDIHGSLSPTLIMRVDLNDDLDIEDQDALQAIYLQNLTDGIVFTFGFADPGGGFTAWCVNSRTGAITEYDNFNFNSFAQMGHHFLAASATGLYVLDGALDDTTSVISRVKSGSAQFSGSRYTSLDACYLGCRVSDSGRDWLLKLRTGDGRTYVYKFRPLNQRTTKIFFGKGLRARYFSWELITAGEEFDLDAIEFTPIGATRRV